MTFKQRLEAINDRLGSRDDWPAQVIRARIFRKWCDLIV